MATYPYRALDGRLLFEVVRYDPKGFRQRRPLEGGGWAWNLRDIEPVLFRLPELAAADPKRTVFVCEGEKGVDALMELGLVATCSPMGAGKWRPSYAEPLRGRHVVVLPDNDQPGRDHAEAVARSLHGVAASVRIVELPGLPGKGDPFDWAKAGGTAAELRDHVRAASPWGPPPTPVATEVPWSGSGPFPRTDLGNGERLVAAFGDRLRYVHPWGQWLVWDGKRWRLDDSAAVVRLAKQAVRFIYHEASACDDDEERRRLVAWGRESENKGRIGAMLWCAASEPTIPALPEDLDRHPWLLNVENGVIDLKTGVLQPHEPGLMITRLCRVPYEPTAECPLWRRMLRHIFAGDETLIAYVQRLCGVFLTGSTSEQMLPIFWGSGSNGKSTMLGTLLEMLGRDYAMKAPPSLLMAKRTPDHPTEVADLFGMRLVVAIETEDGRRLNESLVKELTGGDRIRARRMRQDFWEFKPTHKAVLCTNHRPNIRGTDHAIWRRLKLVPFEVTIADDQQDRSLPDKLAAEFPGILAWCVRGCLAWQEDGLNPPDKVSQATDAYRRDEDVLGSFLEEVCVTRAGMRVKASDVYNAYKAWSERSGENTLNHRRFGQAMTERGFERIKVSDIWYTGLGLRQSEAEF